MSVDRKQRKSKSRYVRSIISRDFSSAFSFAAEVRPSRFEHCSLSGVNVDLYERVEVVFGAFLPLICQSMSL